MRKELVQRIEMERKLRKISVNKISVLIGVSRVTYWRFVNGESDLSLGHIELLMNLMGINVLFYKS
jgi:transcriptional regulator with XRE-family HTH domain